MEESGAAEEAIPMESEVPAEAESTEIADHQLVELGDQDTSPSTDAAAANPVDAHELDAELAEPIAASEQQGADKQTSGHEADIRHEVTDEEPSTDAASEENIVPDAESAATEVLSAVEDQQNVTPTLHHEAEVPEVGANEEADGVQLPEGENDAEATEGVQLSGPAKDPVPSDGQGENQEAEQQEAAEDAHRDSDAPKGQGQQVEPDAEKSTGQEAPGNGPQEKADGGEIGNAAPADTSAQAAEQQEFQASSEFTDSIVKHTPNYSQGDAAGRPYSPERDGLYRPESPSSYVRTASPDLSRGTLMYRCTSPTQRFRTKAGRELSVEQLQASIERLTCTYSSMVSSEGEQSRPESPYFNFSPKTTTKISKDDEEALVARLYTPKPVKTDPPAFPKPVKLAYRSTDKGQVEVWEPVKAAPAAENIAALQELYSRCLETRKKTEEELAAKYLKPLGRKNKA